MSHLTTIRDIEQAVTSVQSDLIDDVIEARTFAEELGERAFHTKEGMPLAFADHSVLSEGFEEGIANAKFARELVRQGML